MHTVFACGADMKNRFCLYRDNQFHVSQDFDNLEIPHNYTAYLGAVRKMLENRIPSVDVVAYDLHPMYFSSRTRELFDSSVATVGVQHHHAHIAAALALDSSSRPVVGVCFDGTGYGSDGNLWGGEFLVVSPQGFTRKAHLRYAKMPGGEKAVLEPWRMAFSLAHECLGDEVYSIDFPFMKQRPREDYLFLQHMMSHTVNTPLTSSAGRLFDAVSSMLGITHAVTFEAEAAINLEKRASLSDDTGTYSVPAHSTDDMFIIDTLALVKALLDDMRNGVPVETISRRFHNTLANVTLERLTAIRQETGIRSVVLSGGVFQNRLLHRLTVDGLRQAGFCRVESTETPVTDLGICMGQIYVALNSV